jgi:hypothetical protein
MYSPIRSRESIFTRLTGLRYLARYSTSRLSQFATGGLPQSGFPVCLLLQLSQPAMFAGIAGAFPFCGFPASSLSGQNRSAYA